MLVFTSFDKILFLLLDEREFFQLQEMNCRNFISRNSIAVSFVTKNGIFKYPRNCFMSTKYLSNFFFVRNAERNFFFPRFQRTWLETCCMYVTFSPFGSSLCVSISIQPIELFHHISPHGSAIGFQSRNKFSHCTFEIFNFFFCVGADFG